MFLNIHNKLILVSLSLSSLLCNLASATIYSDFVPKNRFGFPKWSTNGTKWWDTKESQLPRPSILDNPEYGIHSFIQLKDVKLHYVENGDRSKPLMFFVHGFPEFWFSWRHQLKHFAKTHWVVAIDMRGYGESDKPKEISSYKIENLQNDIVQVVHGLGRKDCILVSHDWGGVVSWYTTMNHPEIVQKLIVMNAAHPGAYRKLLRSKWMQYVMSSYSFTFHIPYLPESLSAFWRRGLFQFFLSQSSTTEEIEAYVYTFSKKESWTRPLNYYRSNGGFAPKKWDDNGKAIQFPVITKPTLIIWGEKDFYLHKSLPQLTKPYVKDLRIEYVQGANHFVQIDAPDEVNRLIESFL